MLLMRPAVSSTASALPGALGLQSTCIKCPLLQPTKACTLFLALLAQHSESKRNFCPLQFASGHFIGLVRRQQLGYRLSMLMQSICLTLSRAAL